MRLQGSLSGSSVEQGAHLSRASVEYPCELDQIRRDGLLPGVAPLLLAARHLLDDELVLVEDIGHVQPLNRGDLAAHALRMRELREEEGRHLGGWMGEWMGEWGGWRRAGGR